MFFHRPLIQRAPAQLSPALRMPSRKRSISSLTVATQMPGAVGKVQQKR
jgi:hypothetical protein